MRTTEPRRALWIWAPMGLVATLAGAACQDALRLDPPGGTGGGHTTGSTGTGTCPKACSYPTPVCDGATKTCVECATVADCGDKPGTICSKGQCSCSSSDPKVTLLYCAGETPTCVDAQTSATDCGSCGHACFGNCTTGKCADKWEPTATVGAPAARSHHVAVWTGSQMFVWGGKVGGVYLDTGGLYDPVKRTWTATSQVNAPSPRADATAVWDTNDSKVIVWGGAGLSGVTNTGGIYDPAKNVWTATDRTMAPAPRVQHTAVWATQMGTPSMIVWGGADMAGTKLGDGASFDPVLNKWAATADAAGFLTARGQHTAVWDTGGTRMVVFGGYGPSGATMTLGPLGDGATLDSTGTWAALDTTTTPGPSARNSHTAVYDNTSTVVWGGVSGATTLGDGAILTGANWSSLVTVPPQPEARTNHTAVVVSVSSKTQMIIFGGEAAGVSFATGWSLDINGNVWSALPTAPEARTHHTAVATGTPASPGSSMIVWGGDVAGGVTNTGAVWDATP